jgi:hypothetical protein
MVFGIIVLEALLMLPTKTTANKNNHNGWMFLFGTCKAPPGSEYEYAL